MWSSILANLRVNSNRDRRLRPRRQTTPCACSVPGASGLIETALRQLFVQHNRPVAVGKREVLQAIEIEIRQARTAKPTGLRGGFNEVQLRGLFPLTEGQGAEPNTSKQEMTKGAHKTV